MSGYYNTCVAYILVLQLLSCPISTMCGVVDSERHYCYTRDSSSTYTTYIYTDDQSVDTFAMELIHICLDYSLYDQLQKVSPAHWERDINVSIDSLGLSPVNLYEIKLSYFLPPLPPYIHKN